ncbi:MAG: PKD domain-containing protein [Candidatus Brockarchaeota archaeon]|nr:PKD domain-containing protein [Candidatus Brockarchaeota archaeon]
MSNLIDPDGKIVSWRWFFGDGDEGFGESATHAYAKEGNYTVALIVSDDEGEMGWCVQRISVGPAPRPLKGKPGMEHYIWVFTVLIVVIIVTVTYVIFKKYFSRSKGKVQTLAKEKEVFLRLA